MPPFRIRRNRPKRPGQFPTPRFTGLTVNVYSPTGVLVSSEHYIAQPHEDVHTIRVSKAREFGARLTNVEVIPA